MSVPAAKEPGDDYRGADPDFLSEIIRQGELRLAAQLQAALAADARGGWLASVGAAGAAALIAVGAQETVVGKEELASYFGACAFAISAILAAFGARPVKFEFPGMRPADNVPAIGDTAWPTHRSKAAYAQYLDEYVEANDDFMARNAHWTRRAMFAAVCAPVVALLILTIP